MYDLTLYFSNAYVEMIRTDERSVYPSCPTWSKKMIQEITDERWRWEKWDTFYQKPKYQFILLFTCSEGAPNGHLWINTFREEAEVVLGGMSAEEFHNLLVASFTDMDEIRAVGNDNRFRR